MVLSTPDKNITSELYKTIEDNYFYTINYYNGFELDFEPERHMFILKSGIISFFLLYCDRDIDELIRTVSSEPNYFVLYMIQNGIACETSNNTKIVITYGGKTIYRTFFFNEEREYYVFKINILNTYKMDIERIRMPYY
jgi:hypothetical protein